MAISAWAERNLLDSQLNFLSQASPVYLRLKNEVQDDNAYSALGFQISITGNDRTTGYTDLKILPPPAVAPVSTHDIGISGGRLQFGATRFTVSDTFVQKRMIEKGYTDPWQVFRDREVLGIQYNGRLYSLDSIITEQLGEESVYWEITGNAHEPQVNTQ